jgi:Na+-translocating ferredoxin:NAD+ oxidoreductase RnfD subunit
MSTVLELGGAQSNAIEPLSTRDIVLGRRRVSVRGPSIRDPRLHLSAVVLAVLTLGIGWMHFDVSLAHLLLAVLTCGGLEAGLVFRRTGILVWPASAMQTATSTVLILRVTGWERSGLFDLDHWYLFVGVAVVGVLSKYLIRVGGRHLFNPSNVALVVAFVALGSGRIEPLALWWAPFGLPVVLTYLVILGGGVLIDRRLHLLEMAAVFWVVLALGIGLLSLQGHSIATDWSFAPISGGHFWLIVMTSPEILLFSFFMVTDPRTVPSSRAARIRFAASVGLLSVLLAAPWGTEFGTKVGVLAGLAIGSIIRLLIERWPLRTVPRRMPLRAVAAIAAVAVTGSVILALGRNTVALASIPPATSVARVDLSSIPVPTVDADVAGVGAGLATPDGAHTLALRLAEDLAVEAEAFRLGDPSILEAVDHGDRLAAQAERVSLDATADGIRTFLEYRFESIHLSVVFPGGAQSGANVGLAVSGFITEVDVDASGRTIERRIRRFDTLFSMRQVQPGRWFITNELPQIG